MKRKLGLFKQWRSIKEWQPVRLVQRRIGLDLGSSQIRIWDSVTDKELSMPACLAVDTKTNDVVAFGVDAAEMMGRSAANIKVIWPIEKGIITDEEATLLLLRMMLQELIKGGLVFRPVILASIPVATTQADKQTIVQVLNRLGAREVNTIASSLAASIGAQVPIADTTGCFLLQLGDQVVEAAAISLGRIVTSQSQHYGGAKLKKRLAAAIKKQFGIDLSQQEIEQVLTQIASLAPGYKEKIEVVGKATQFSPSMEQIDITTADIKNILELTAEKVADTLSRVLAQVPAELAGDAINKGILLSGGMANLNGIDRYLSEKFRMPVLVVDHPESTAIKGVKSVLKVWNEFKAGFGYDE